MYFRGRSQRSLDPKGRLLLPPGFRESLMARETAGPAVVSDGQKGWDMDSASASPFPAPGANGIPFPDMNSGLATDPAQPDAAAGTGAHPTKQDGTSTPHSLMNAAAPGGRFMLTTYDGCLVAYPWTDWLDLEAKFSRLPNPSPRVRAFRRLFIGGAEEQIPDAQGRIRLSQDHREYAGLNRDVTILGLVNRFELWNPEKLKASMDAQNLDDVTEELANSGIDFAL